MSKTAQIREALKTNPTLTPKEIAARLGDGFTPQYVSLVKSQDKKRAASGGKAKRGRKPKAAPVAARKVKANSEVTLAKHGDTQLGHAYVFAQACGGISNAVETLKTLESLQVK